MVDVVHEPSAVPPEDPADDVGTCSGCGGTVDVSDLVPHKDRLFCVDEGCALKALLDDTDANLGALQLDQVIALRTQTAMFLSALDHETNRRLS